MNIWNNKGELNASSVKEAAMILAKLAAAQEGQPSNVGLSHNMDPSREAAMVDQAINTESGKISLAQAMANPINS